MTKVLHDAETHHMIDTGILGKNAGELIAEVALAIEMGAEQNRRMVFNIVARNQDDHTKNISFLMDKTGQWSLSPAYDVTYSHNPAGKWTNHHQMSVNGKQDNFVLEDLIQTGGSISLNKSEQIINDVLAAVDNWKSYAGNAGVKKDLVAEISFYHRTGF